VTSNRPRPGDVLIRIEQEQHVVTLVPHSLGFHFDELCEATRFALGLANGRQASAWQTTDGQTFEPLS
jgi:hypothetical protein